MTCTNTISSEITCECSGGAGPRRACCPSPCQHHSQCGRHLLTIMARCKTCATSAPLLACMQDPRIQRLPCTHSGTYADDCLCDRVRQHKCYIVATCDRDLRRRIRKVLYVCLQLSNHSCTSSNMLPEVLQVIWHATRKIECFVCV